MTTDDPLEQTKALWEPRYGRKLSDEEAHEILRNAVGFFTILEEWASRENDAEWKTKAATEEESHR